MIALFVVLALQCPDGSPPPCGRVIPRATTPAATSVAVLYFDNLSRDTADAYVADGLTEELITRLGQIERLQVKSRTAVQRYRGRAIDDPSALGRTLGVAHLVSGSVRRGGGRMRVTVEMTRAATGVRVWGDSYERRTSADVRRAITEYEMAVRLDPELARAWARVGLAYYLYLDWDWPWPGVPADSMLARGFAAADRALALDSANSDAWMARGLLLTYRYKADFRGAPEALERAVALDSRNAEAWHQLGGTYMYMLDNPRARRAYERSLELDPQRMITLTNLGLQLRYEGRTAEALPLHDSAIATNPDSYYARVMRGWARLAMGNVVAAREDLDAAERLRPADWFIDTDALGAAVLAAQSDSAAARRRADRIGTLVAGTGPLTYQQSVFAATAFVATGQNERAIAALERSAGWGVHVWWVLHDPYLAPLRSDPRFQRLRESVRPPWAAR